MATPSSTTRNLAGKFVFTLAVLLILIGVVLYWVQRQLSSMRASGEQPVLQVGAVMPDFTLHRFKGGSLALSQLKAKIVLVNFWASWCEACIIEMPALVQLRKSYKNRGFEIVALNVDENPSAVLPSLLNQLGIDFPVYLDSDNKLATLFDVHAIPLTVLLNQQRQVLLIESGEKDWNGSRFRSILEKWLSES